MTEIFSIQNKIKHADWPYILQTLFFYFVLVAVGRLIFSGMAFTIFLLTVTLFFIILSQFHIYRLWDAEREHLQHKTQVLNEIYKLLPIRAPLPSMTGWAATPELSSFLLKSIQKYRPATIVEIGSGVTTLISGYSLEKFNIDGKIISFDHDPQFAAKTMDEIKLHGLSDKVDIRIAPLEKVTIDNIEWEWYSTDKIKFDQPIDLLVVDGPPVKTQKNARYPALPLLYKYLSENAVVIMHDTNRVDESTIIKLWQEKFEDFTVEKFHTEKGITLLKRGF
ncbi:class I SAM-dependent methyltransferase [Rhodohalobacter sp.]|uniref:class I SAM-dependent methyltransferase n=1 Tax=Rhodohalobacter sp. TaxID=1974210 RepID=UPI002ACE51A6|nr:class I SAM-dependent methyltransferase [Rhodohalobacter sp.]MDZ7755547.1 class I SAM-dependent methyltransferase [Rhodohalobacter sp.]